MKKPIILYLIRSEADLERVISLAIPGKNYSNQQLIYFGDISMNFEFGIKNRFQKYLLKKNKLDVIDAISFSIFGRVYNYIYVKQSRSEKKLYLLIIRILLKVIRKIIYSRQKHLADCIVKKINPDIFITDCSSAWNDYFPEIMRSVARERKIKIFLIPHGPAGGLLNKIIDVDDITDKGFFPYDGCVIGICSKYDIGNSSSNRVVVGDPADSLPFLTYKHNESYGEIDFFNDRKYKIGFLVALSEPPISSGWSIIENIILDYANEPNVAMVVKLHPRMYSRDDFRVMDDIDNVKIYNSELDRSRLVKWADIVVCIDHSSTVFEPMIIEKKVVAICAKIAKPKAHLESPVKNSDPSINSISRSSEFDLNNLTNYTSDKSFINEYCWGGHGPIDLGEKIIRDLTNELNDTPSNSN